ncbi:MAG: insulinase family protein, partial [Bacteroidetes bacterium]|nr:insulinase family protein [Bacteroidota bacterium]
MNTTLRMFGAILLCLGMTVSAWAQKPDRSAPPQLGPPPSFSMAAIQHFSLSNGVPVVLLEKHQVPLVQINLLVRAGSVLDPPGKTGLASMMASMMMEGAGGRDALQLADAIDFLGAQVGSSAGMHTAGVTLQTPLSKLDSALALQADIALRPAFAPAELERKRKSRLTTLLQWRDEPRSLATLTFNNTLYGSAHPYGASSIGDEQAIRSLRVEDLRQFHARYFCPDNAVLIVVGDVTAAEMKPKLEREFGAWKGNAEAGLALPQIKQVEKRSIVLVDKPGAAQTEIRIGRIGASRITDDYYPLVVMNTILGGSFSSRLNQNLREQHGYTYGAGSSFAFRLLPGPFLAGAAVHTAITDSALMEFMKELDAIQKPVPDAELERAKNYIALGFPGEFQTVGEIAGKLEEMVIYDLAD